MATFMDGQGACPLAVPVCWQIKPDNDVAQKAHM